MLEWGTEVIFPPCQPGFGGSTISTFTITKRSKTSCAIFIATLSASSYAAGRRIGPGPASATTLRDRKESSKLNRIGRRTSEKGQPDDYARSATTPLKQKKLEWATCRPAWGALVKCITCNSKATTFSSRIVGNNAATQDRFLSMMFLFAQQDCIGVIRAYAAEVCCAGGPVLHLRNRSLTEPIRRTRICKPFFCKRAERPFEYVHRSPGIFSSSQIVCQRPFCGTPRVVLEYVLPYPPDNGKRGRLPITC